MDAPEGVWAHIAVMAAVTYAIRLIPLLILRREIRNPWFRAFLHYVPYATLTAMTLPAAVVSAPHPLAGTAGLLVAGALALRGHGLLLAAAASSLAVWLAQLALPS